MPIRTDPAHWSHSRAGAACVLRWLAYTPARIGEPALPLATSDPVTRGIDYRPGESELAGLGTGWVLPMTAGRPGLRAAPAWQLRFAPVPTTSPWPWHSPRQLAPHCTHRTLPSTPPHPPTGEKLDPRLAIAGAELPSPPGHSPAEAAWQSGLFDRGSWLEAQAGWARTVVTGRARLGGIPVGVVAVETQTVMLNIAADPGMPDSSERTIPQVGAVECGDRVWGGVQ